MDEILEKQAVKRVLAALAENQIKGEVKILSETAKSAAKYSRSQPDGSEYGSVSKSKETHSFNHCHFLDCDVSIYDPAIRVTNCSWPRISSHC